MKCRSDEAGQASVVPHPILVMGGEDAILENAIDFDDAAAPDRRRRQRRQDSGAPRAC
jgi:hypothetical protein